MRNIAIGLLLLTLTACGAAETGTGTGTGSDSTGANQPVTKPLPSGAAPSGGTATSGGDVLSGSPGTNLMGDLGDLEKGVAAALSATVNKPADSLKLQNKEQTEWSDGSLGCPKPGMMYTQALVPGFKLTYSDGAQTYEVHTDQTGKTAIWCDKGDPKSLGM